jgi:hypothetical protein
MGFSRPGLRTAWPTTGIDSRFIGGLTTFFMIPENIASQGRAKQI